MSAISFEVGLVLLLILLNGVLAMSELAVVSARKIRLQQRAEGGDSSARLALELQENPSRFLSTVQVGITMVGILTGAFGGATIAEKIDEWLERWPAIEPYSAPLSLVFVVLLITYLSLVIGELVPKRLALNNPERVATLVARPMYLLSRIAAPAAIVLSFSTETVLRLLRVRQTDEPPITEEEISVMLEQGTQAGIFEEEEQELFSRIFALGDQRIASLMTPRRKISWLDINDSPDEIRMHVLRERHNRFVVCDDSLDHVLGVVELTDLWAASDPVTAPLDLRALLRKPHFIPEGTRALRVLELMRESGMYLALIVDEYGGIEGMVTLHDIIEEIVGELTSIGSSAEPPIVERGDGSWLVDASLSMDEVRETIHLTEDEDEERGHYRTLGGFILAELGRIPSSADTFEREGFRFEVVDMDGHRVDKVLVTRLPRPASDGAAGK